LQIEQALHDGTPLHGIAFDIDKAFDRVPHNLLFALVAKMGMPRQLIGPLREMYLTLRKRLKYARTVGGYVLRNDTKSPFYPPGDPRIPPCAPLVACEKETVAPLTKVSARATFLFFYVLLGSPVSQQPTVINRII